MIIKTRHYLDEDGLLVSYYPFVYPYLMHCNHIWGSTYKTKLKHSVIHTIKHYALFHKNV